VRAQVDGLVIFNFRIRINMKNTNFSYFYHGAVGFYNHWPLVNGTNYKGATKNKPCVRTKSPKRG
jgi:hypothetical protein